MRDVSISVLYSLVLTAILLLNGFVNACSCATDPNLKNRQKLDFKHADFAFIGDVVSLNQENGDYVVVVNEIFKGKAVIGDSLLGFICDTDRCGPNINKTGQWIIYANDCEGRLGVRSCGITRKLDDPSRVSSHQIADPKDGLNFNRDSFLTVLRSPEFQAKRKFQSYVDLENEIAALRGGYVMGWTNETISAEYNGEVKLPADLLKTYTAFINELEEEPHLVSDIVKKHSLKQAIFIEEGQIRPDSVKYYGNEVNIAFLLNQFQPQIMNARMEEEQTYLIRTGTSAMWFVKTVSSEWKMYKYLDKPVD
jgi:hypothetical protein